MVVMNQRKPNTLANVNTAEFFGKEIQNAKSTRLILSVNEESEHFYAR